MKKKIAFIVLCFLCTSCPKTGLDGAYTIQKSDEKGTYIYSGLKLNEKEIALLDLECYLSYNEKSINVEVPYELEKEIIIESVGLYFTGFSYKEYYFNLSIFIETSPLESGYNINLDIDSRIDVKLFDEYFYFFFAYKDPITSETLKIENYTINFLFKQ